MIKVYAGIVTLAFAREPSAKAKKCKNDATARGGSEHATSHARGLLVSTEPIAACPYICGLSTNPVKQVTCIAGTNLPLHICSRRKPNPHCNLCPSCRVKTEDCEHMLTCKESNRVDCLLKSTDRLDKWIGLQGAELA